MGGLVVKKVGALQARTTKTDDLGLFTWTDRQELSRCGRIDIWDSIPRHTS